MIAHSENTGITDEPPALQLQIPEGFTEPEERMQFLVFLNRARRADFHQACCTVERSGSAAGVHPRLLPHMSKIVTAVKVPSTDFTAQ